MRPGSIHCLLLLALAGGLAACATVVPRELVAPLPVPASPARAVGLPTVAATPRQAAALPPGLASPGAAFSLADVVEVALATSPATRATFAQARAAAEQVGVERAAYYPSLDLSLGATRGRVSPDGRETPTATTWGPAATLSWLLLDLGGRNASAAEARLALLAALWGHDAAVQAVVFGVQQAYFQYQNARAQAEAAATAVKQVATALEAASVRHDAGVATIADVLQARTAHSQARLTLASAEGQVQTLRGALATAMGLAADLPLDVTALPGEPPLEAVDTEVEPLIQEALGRRPELGASRAVAEKAAMGVAAARSEGLPTLSLSATAYRTTYHPDVVAGHADSWSARLLLGFPLFTGFESTHQVARAREEAAAARAQTASLEQQVVLQVWTAFYTLQTAGQRVRASRDLLASAEQSERVALGRYREGVGTILDLLAAQSSLASARAQEIQARTDFFVASAALARATGAVTVPETTVAIEERHP